MGKGGGTTQSTGTTYQTNIPEYAEPYVNTMLGATQRQLFDIQGGEITGFKPYKPYSTSPSDYVAPFSPMQQEAFRGAQQLGPSPLGEMGGRMAGAATMGALGTDYDPYRMGQFTSGRAAQYMNPFLEQAMEPQLREAQRTSEMQRVADQAQATRAGAFGGGRQAIVEAERQRNLGMLQGDIRAKGYMSAFDQAQQNFAREQQMREQSRQFGAGLGIQGLQTALQGAGTMGQLGQTQFGQQQAALGLKQQFGAMQQAQEQQKINQAIQDFANAQQYPLMQLGVMSNMLRGLPMQAATTNQYVAAPNPITQGIGAAGTYAALQNAGMFGKPGGAAGGLPSEFKYAKGGITSVPRYDVGGEVESQLESMDTESLAKQAQESSSPTVRRMAQRILRERQMERGADQGAGPTGPMGIDYQAPQMAAGGIVAFQAGGTPAERSVQDIMAENAALDARRKAEDEVREAFFREHGAYAVTPDPQGLARSEAARRNITVQELAPMTSPVQAQPSAAAAAEPAPVARTASAPVVHGEAPRPPVPFAERGVTQAAPAAPAPAAVVPPAERRAASGAATAEGTAGEAEARANVPAAPAGITAATPTAPAYAGAIADVQRMLTEAGAEAKRPESSFLEEVKRGAPENVAAAEYRKQIMAERANAKQEAERQRQMRLAEFFARWGSTPGPTLAAGLKAMEKSIPDMITDEKEQKKARRELDKVQFDIDNSIRMEELGFIKEARGLKEKARDRFMNLNERYAQILGAQQTAETSAGATRYSADKQLEAARLRAQEDAANRGESRKSREAREAETRYSVANRQLEITEANIARARESETYRGALEAIQRAEMMPGVRDPQGRVDPSKIPEVLRSQYDSAKKLIQERNAEFDARRARAQAAVARAGAAIGVEDVTGAADTMSPEDRAALNWANANPNDPRSAQIKQRLGVR